MENSKIEPWYKEADQESTYALHGAKDLAPLLTRIGKARCVMLGEASHGTHEYYTWRTAITRRLIEEKGFNFVAVEGDWPDCYRLNRYVRGYGDKDKTSREVLRSFERWPTWMWANWEIDALITYLKEHNAGLPANKRVGFYGLDVYSLWESMEAIMEYLEEYDADSAEKARQAIRCFEPYGEDAQNYARAQYGLKASCRQEVIDLLAEIRNRAPQYDHDPEASLNMEQNAYIAVNAERYYANMVGFDDKTWNIRDQHMMETLSRLMDFHGLDSKVVVWEHNTHIGDARYTDMKHAGLFNLGQLARQQFGELDTVLVGFGSYAGSVLAGQFWGAPMEEMTVPPAREGSIEDILHRESEENRLLIFNRNEASQDRFRQPLPHRAIGVVYQAGQEKRGNYVPTVLSRRYDAFIYLDTTSALHPIRLQPDISKVPETYPFTV